MGNYKMPHLISNLVEKSFTPSTARLAPKHLWSRPALGRKACKVGRLGADPTFKAMWRMIRSWVCHNHKVYYTYVMGVGFMVYQFWWYQTIGYYRRHNHHRSLEWACQKEREWDLIKPKEEEYGDEEEESDSDDHTLITKTT